MTYTGVLLSNALNVARVRSDATQMRAIALNDYKVTVPLDVTRWPVILATLRDGKRMPDTDKGPIEIVFPNKTENIDPPMLYNPMWIWQLRRMVIE